MTQFKDLKPKEILSETQFYTVEKTNKNQAELVNEQGEHIIVDDKYVNSCLLSGNQFSSEKQINKTDAATLFLASGNVAMTVNFNKQVKEADVLKEIMDKVDGAPIKDIEKAVKAGLKRAIGGEERTMRGYHKGELNELGRVNFVDLEIARGENQIRQVDPRTINFLIIKGIKYTIK